MAHGGVVVVLRRAGGDGGDGSVGGVASAALATLGRRRQQGGVEGGVGGGGRWRSPPVTPRRHAWRAGERARRGRQRRRLAVPGAAIIVAGKSATRAGEQPTKMAVAMRLQA